MVEQHDLVSRLQTAAANVIRNQGPTIRRDPSTLRSVTVELELNRDGQVTAAEVYVARRVTTASILGVHDHPRPKGT